MKFLHMADLHLGKRLNDVSLLEDQKCALDQAAALAAENGVNAVLIAGDIYQRSSPQAEAMQLFNHFVTALWEKNIRVIAISGNHDSDKRVAYFSKLVEANGVYISEVFDGTMGRVRLSDEYGPVNVYMLPFIRPASVKRFFPEDAIETFEDAVAAAIRHADIDFTERNVLVCHQLVTGAETCDSEEMIIGGLDNISASVFDGFDYVALGHIHKPQKAGRESMRYAGSLLKYSLSEKDHKKSVALVEMREKGDTAVSLLPIVPARDVREVRGDMDALLRLPYTTDYVRVVLTDELPPPDACVTLTAANFPNMIKFSVENSKTQADTDISEQTNIESKTTEALFSEFYALQNGGTEPDQTQMNLIRDLIRELEAEAE